MAAAFLLVLITASFTIVRIGAVALELTGLPWEQAKFQALSAFTNAGFTTRESERVLRHPLRRRVVSVLIVLGNVGLVTTVGTFASTIMGTNLKELGINLGAMLIGITVISWLARKPRLAQRLRQAAQSRLSRRYGIEIPPEELLHLEQGYVLTRVSLPNDWPHSGKTLAELQLDQLQVLAIERENEFVAAPKGQHTLNGGDQLIVYGSRDATRKTFMSTGQHLGAFAATQLSAGL